MISQRVRGLKAYKTETTPAKVKLSSNELNVDFPDYVKERIKEEVSKIPINRYPDPKAEKLKEAIAYRFGVKPENILLGNGSDELIYYLSIAVGEFNRGVFYPVPTFPMYEISARIFGRDRVEVPLDRNFDLDLPSSVKAIQEKDPVLAYFSFPNNPTGGCFSEEKINAIRNLGLFCVIDEAYYHYSKRTFLQEALKSDSLVILRTLSKIGMAGLRVGILIGREDVIYELDKMRLPFNITYPSQVIARLMLTEFYDLIEKEVQKVIREREKLFESLRSFKELEVFPSDANFILFRVKSMSADELHSKLVERGVLIRNVSYLPGLDGCLRVSIGRSEENEIFLQALHSVLSL